MIVYEMTTVREQIESKEIDINEYSSRGTVGGRNAVYGGQIIGQALTSAFNSIHDLDSVFQLHSVHCYFVSPLKYDQDICYKVQRIKEGKSFCSLTIDVMQGSNVMSKFMVSFDKPESPNSSVLDFNTRKMPTVPHPDSLTDTVDSEGLNLFDFNEYFRSKYSFPGLDIYMCLTLQEIEDFGVGRPISAKFLAWIKANSGYTQQDHQNYHRATLAFASDLFMAQCILNAFPKVKLSKVTSLDHSIWFHTDCSSQDWHLFVIECEHCKGGRALNSLRIYKEDSTLVATCKQEALCRPKL